ncbi:MAG: sarcosine oxidase subunit gamma [Phenylobacterium sp.]|uniref:sarcosine oxidase subunit gamma n=1 Tax=Phenylobacterium sp. TaxID=1871053 RepID=UPI0025F05140|nr:sarcosine oxidase subunit gamma family protein [Phenylobacterium sp.]MBI1200646.1 sarcosine oxidase subunit gamma [Phenylobacterium sp.]
MPELDTTPRSAFDGLLPLAGPHDGLEVIDRDGCGLATLVVRRDARKALRAALISQYGVELRDGPVVSRGARISLIGTGADSWLAVSAGPNAGLYADLAARLAGCASLSDQSDGYGLLGVRGANAATVLQRLLPIDLHPDAFPVGAAAATLAAHIPLLLWRSGEAEFEVAVFRSYAGSFIHALDGAARPFRRSAAPTARG